MMESILESIKTLLGPGADDPHFDADIIIHINSVLQILTQVGVGPEDGFTITGPEETWEDFLGEENAKKLSAVKTYMYLKVKMIFDPPTSSAVIDSYNRLIDQFEWRLNVHVDK